MQIKKYTPYILAVLSGILLALSFPPLSLWPFAFIALMPLFFAIKGQSVKKSFLLGLIAGFVFYSILGFWLIRTLVEFSVPVFVFFVIGIFVSLSFGLATALITHLRKYEFIIIAPVVWVAVEYLKTQTEFAYPGGIIAYSQYLNLPLIQISSIFGALVISFIIVLVNAFIFSLLDVRKITPKLKIAFVLMSILLITALVFGMQRNIQNDKKLKVTLVQTNFIFAEKFNNTKVKSMLQSASMIESDLMVLPESAFSNRSLLPNTTKIDLVTGLKNPNNGAILIEENGKRTEYTKMKLI